MNRHTKTLPYFLIIILLSTVWACKEAPRSELEDQLVIRLSSEPTSLSPILSPNSFEKEIHEYIFISMGDYHPTTMELIPVLIEKVPTATPIEQGEITDASAYAIRIKEDATWSDGSPITGHDINNTFKLALHPGVVAPSWKGLLNDVIDINIDADDPKSFTIIMQGNYFLQLEGILSAEIYPKHIYDAQGILDNYSFAELKDENFDDDSKATNPAFLQLGKDFSSTKYTQQIIEGAGPYELEKWETGQYISIKRKDNYWGNNYPDNPFLKSFSDRIVFRIIPDATVALSLLKSDEIDFLDMYRLPYASYEELASNTEDDDIAVHQNSLPRSYLIYANHEDSRLQDKAVRLALNKCLNVDRIIGQIEGGNASPSNSWVPKGRKEYNSNLGYIGYDIAAANSILAEAGWIDTDSDNVRDKVINGRKEKLALRFHNTGSTLGEGIASILIDEAKKVGIEIINTVKPYREASRENLYTGDFELFAAASTAPEARQDLYIQWHSSSIGSGGRNYSRYNNPKADLQMETIRSSSGQEQIDAYHELQQIMYDDAAFLFLYSPMGRIAADDDLEVLLSSKTPGYFANGFKSL